MLSALSQLVDRQALRSFSRAGTQGRHRMQRTVEATAAPLSDEAFYPHGLVSLTPNHRMANTIKRLGSVEAQPMVGESRFIRPQSIFFDLDGQQRRWDMVGGMPSVGCLLYHRDLQAVLLVRQFRPPVYIACWEEAGPGAPPPPLSAGFTYELCAGLVDKAKPLEQIVKEEVLEECGYDVPLSSIRFVTSYVAASGSMGTWQRMYAAEVDDTMLVLPGGGLRAEGEAVEVVALPNSGMQAFFEDDSLAKSAALPFAFLWVQQQLEKNGGRLLGG